MKTYRDKAERGGSSSQGLVGAQKQREQQLIAVSHRLPGDRRSATTSRQTAHFRRPHVCLPPDKNSFYGAGEGGRIIGGKNWAHKHSFFNKEFVARVFVYNDACSLLVTTDHQCNACNSCSKIQLHHHITTFLSLCLLPVSSPSSSLQLSGLICAVHYGLRDPRLVS